MAMIEDKAQRSPLGGLLGLFRNRRRLPCLLVLVAFIGFTDLPRPEAAQELSPASLFVDNLGRQAIATAGNKTLTPARRLAEFRTLLRRGFAIKGIARHAMAKYWRRATPSQRTRYLALFEDYIVYTYLRRFDGYGGQIFRITKERDLGRKGVIVYMSIIDGDKPPIKVRWQVRQSRKSKRFRIVDLVIEGLSMAATQRSEYATAISNHGGKIDLFLADLQAQVDKAQAAQSARK